MDRNKLMVTGRVKILLFASVFIFCGCGATYTGRAGSKAVFEQIDVFVSGLEGYNTFRIPAVAVTKKGTILAFCEGRKNSRSDAGNIDIVLKRGSDNGNTWQELQVVWDDGNNTCGNPCVAVDRQTGTIWLLMTWNLGSDHENQIIESKSKDTRRVYVTFSTDDGVTWAEPKEITADVKKADWTWYATGPGNGIQLRSGKYKSRLIIPCDHIEAGSKKYYSHVIYSDDHGKSWRLGGSTPSDMVNECQAVELSDGRLMLNMRNYDPGKKFRAVSSSTDGGRTWSKVTHDAVLIEPICQAGFIRYRGGDIHGKGRLLFSNPASKDQRIKMTVRLSYDNAKTWPISKLIHSGPSAYSCLTTLKDFSIGLLYERGQAHPYEKITFAKFNLNYLSDNELAER
jgi:sialidase-1